MKRKRKILKSIIILLITWSVIYSIRCTTDFNYEFKGNQDQQEYYVENINLSGNITRFPWGRFRIHASLSIDQDIYKIKKIRKVDTGYDIELLIESTEEYASSGVGWITGNIFDDTVTKIEIFFVTTTNEGVSKSYIITGDRAD